MTLLFVAGVALLIGAVLALSVPGAAARAGSSVAAQAIATVATLGAVVPVLAGGPPLTARIAWSYPVQSVVFRVDGLSAFFLAWSLPMTLLGSVYAWAYLRDDLRAGRNAGPHFALLSALSLSYLLVYAAQDLTVFLLGWEIAAVCAWLLVIWSYRSQKIRFAGFNYLVSTHVGLFVLAAALMTLHAQTGSTDFADFAAFLSRPGPLRDVTFVLLGVAFALKAAFFPFHTWLPRAHAAAPAHVSALMSGVIHKAGLFAFLRFTMLLGEPAEWMGWAVLAFGATSAVVGALFTTTQRDLKRLLGYSSTENVGVAAMGFGVGYFGLSWHRPELAALGFVGGLLHLVNHAFFKCLLFYAAGAVHKATHTVDLDRLGGLGRAMPRTAALFLLGGLAIAALPPLNGFVSEFLLQGSLLRSGASGNAAAALVLFAGCLAFTGATSAFSMVRAFGIVFLGTPRDPEAAAHAGDPPAAMLAPMVLHAVGVLILGLFPGAGLALAGPAAGSLGDVAVAREVVAHLGTANLVLLVAVGVPVAFGAWLAARRPAPVHVTWGCGYTGPTARVQYTGTSFSLPFAELFASWMPPRVSRVPPTGFFPERASVRTGYPDPIERRLYEGLDQGEDLVTGVFRRLATEPRVVFGAGLVLVLAVAWFTGGAA